MPEQELDTSAVVKLLNRILELELAGVVRYTHYSMMVFGPHRIPIIDWLRAEANEGLQHAYEAGELVTHLGEHPSLAIGPLLETHNHDIDAILHETMEHEKEALNVYKQLLALVEGHSVMLEEYARTKVLTEEQHLGHVDKMLRSPGHIGTFQ